MHLDLLWSVEPDLEYGSPKNIYDQSLVVCWSMPCQSPVLKEARTVRDRIIVFQLDEEGRKAPNRHDFGTTSGRILSSLEPLQLSHFSYSFSTYSLSFSYFGRWMSFTRKERERYQLHPADSSGSRAFEMDPLNWSRSKTWRESNHKILGANFPQALDENKNPMPLPSLKRPGNWLRERQRSRDGWNKGQKK